MQKLYLVTVILLATDVKCVVLLHTNDILVVYKNITSTHTIEKKVS